MKISEKVRFHAYKLLGLYFICSLLVLFPVYLNFVFVNTVDSLLKMHLLLLLPAYFYFVRNKVGNLFLFLLAHLLPGVLVVVFFLPSVQIFSVVCMAIGILLLMISSFVFKNRQEQFEITTAAGFATAIAVAAAYIVISLIREEAAESTRFYLMIFSIVLMIMFFAYMHIGNVNKTIQNVSDMITQPVDKIRKYNHKILFVFLLVSILAAVLSLLLHAENLIYSAGNILLEVLRFIVRLFSGKGGSTEDPIMSDEPVISDGPGGGFDLPPGEPAAIWVILEYLAIAACILGAVVLVGYALYRFYKWFYSRKNAAVQVSEYDEVSNFVEEEKEKADQKKEGSFWSRLFLNNRQKVRRIYKKQLENAMDSGKFTVSDTPGEILQKEPSEKMKRLTEIYEKARYTEKEITKEDLKYMINHH